MWAAASLVLLLLAAAKDPGQLPHDLKDVSYGRTVLSLSFSLSPSLPFSLHPSLFDTEIKSHRATLVCYILSCTFFYFLLILSSFLPSPIIYSSKYADSI